MGSEDLFHKKKQKALQATKRRNANRKPYDKTLIVCEGLKTEPLYFRELIDHYEIHTANVRISGDCGSDPLSVVEHGFQLYENELTSKSDPFDRVYFVFDRDSHVNYQEALGRIKELTPVNTFFAIPSVPCFEYWLLLNFTYTTAPYNSAGDVSAGKAVERQLKIYWPDYHKGRAGTFTFTFNLQNDELAFAKNNSLRALNDAKRNHADNPYTYIHELITYLQQIKTVAKS